jgi:hypothetical protein
MKYGIIKNCTDPAIFQMLFEGKITSVECPYCTNINEHCPDLELVNCSSCNVDFISPLLNPDLVNQEENNGS